MPYVDQKVRDALEPHTQTLPMNPGELNYAVTCLVDEYLAGNLNYQAINDVVGVLECAKLEVYRRIAAPYEDIKLDINGDVYATKVRRPGVKAQP